MSKYNYAVINCLLRDDFQNNKFELRCLKTSNSVEEHFKGGFNMIHKCDCVMCKHKDNIENSFDKISIFSFSPTQQCILHLNATTPHNCRSVLPALPLPFRPVASSVTAASPPTPSRPSSSPASGASAASLIPNPICRSSFRSSRGTS